MYKKTLHKGILFGITILFAGCAVLTVEVDVYKGPLANHQDIQMEQMAAMAIGAKPLLVELRDIVEAENEYWREFTKEGKKWYDFLKVFRSKDLEKRLSYLRGTPWYKPEYIGPYWSEKNKKEFRFKDSDADNVNNILFLYEDRGPREYVDLSDTLFRILLRYKKSFSTLKPKSMAEDKALADKIRREVKPTTPWLGELLTKNVSEKAVEEPNASKLLNAYVQFLRDDRRNALKIVQETHTYLKTIKPLSSSLIELKSKGESDEIAMENATNAAQSLLAETKLVDNCADEIFGLKGELREQFVMRVKQISEAYLESRAALEDFWLAMMDGLATINNMSVADDEEDKCRTKITIRIVDLSLDIIQPRYLAALLDVHNKKFISKDINKLAALLETYPSADPNQPHSMWDYQEMKYFLRKELTEKPAETAKLLKAVHEFSKSALNPEETTIKSFVGNGVLGSLAYKEGWMFGLVRAPFEDGAKELELKKLEMEVQEAFVYGGGAFAGGRLDKGLESLIEDYLKLADNPARNESQESELEAARKALSDALVRFAKKLLFLANNRSLISPPTEPGIITGTLDILSRGLLGERITVGATDYMGWSQAGTNQYTRILQAVGNSIVVQADALHQENKHKKQLEKQYKKDVAILENTARKISLTDQNTVGIESVNELLPKSPPATAKDVRDVWITLLEYEHDLAVRDGNEARADQVMEAIKESRAKREGMIFIRPAMAYLRTSFPATSLQSNPNLTWDNMLGRHMMRSIPFAPQIGEFLDPDAKRDARITAEIDKQFWQNINRVRVAGGGNTNYAVVKDDIGNWYVKGYSANPEDIIQSAQNLALFSAGGKMGTPSLVPSIPAEGPNQVRIAPGSTLETMLSNYEEDYREKTQQGYNLLCEIMSNSRNNIKKQIKDLWNANENVKNKQSELETALNWSYTHFLEPFAPKVKNNVKNLDKKRERIIEGIKRLKQFRNDLIWKITNVYSRDGQATEPNALAGEAAAKSIVKNVVDTQIDNLLTNRKNAIKNYENALMFLAEATKPQKQ